MAFILTYDIGTTGVKTCLFEVDKTIRLLESTSAGYPLYILEGGGAEQDGDEQHDGRLLQVHGHQDAELGVVQVADLVLYIKHRRRVETLAVAHDEGLY